MQWVSSISAVLNRSETAMRVHTLSALAICGVLAVAAAACSTSGTAGTSMNVSAPGALMSGSASPNDSTTSMSSAGATVPASGDAEPTIASVPAAPGGSPAAVNVCSVMSPAAVSAASGWSFNSAVDGSHDTPGVYFCLYSGDSPSLSIGVYQRPDKETFDDLNISGGAQSVSGIGDRASVSPAGILVQVGSRYINIQSAINSASNEAGYESLAKATIPALK